MILLQCDVKHWSFVSPAAKFHLTGLVVKWEPSNINLESERKWYEGASIYTSWLYCRIPLSLMPVVDAVTSSGILKAKQTLGVTFHSDKLGGIDFTKFSKLSMCSAGAGRCWLVQWPRLPPRHCTLSVLKFL